MLGGSWVVISRAISRAAILITHISGRITPLMTTPEPPSVNKLQPSGHHQLQRLYQLLPLGCCGKKGVQGSLGLKCDDLGSVWVSRVR